jgi:hypothetical protein
MPQKRKGKTRRIRQSNRPPTFAATSAPPNSWFYQRPSFWKRAGSIVVAVLGLLLWLPFYLPRINLKIPSSSPVSAQPPSFSVRNDGIISVHHVDAIFFGIATKFRTSHVGNFTISGEIWSLGKITNIITPGAYYEFAVPYAVGAPAIDSDIEMIVTYRPSFTWRKSYACARYVLGLDANKSPAWFRKEPYECALAIRCAALQRGMDIRDRQHPVCWSSDSNERSGR